jgi:P-type Ca2+ transporter type 2C
MNWHLLPLSEISQLLNTDPEGLSQDRASQLLSTYGENRIQELKKNTVGKMLFHQFTEFMILILIAAAAVSALFGDLTDSIIIIAIVIINAFVGFLQEYRAEKAIEALKKITPSNARVLRNGRREEIPVFKLVPGDVLLLKAGNIIPADIRFFETHQLKVNESTLTGESNTVEKDPAELSEGDYPLGDRINMGFKGTHITGGRARAYVVATGMNTELGSIARLIQTEENLTPLQKRLASFGKLLSIYILVICAIVFFIGWLRGEELIRMLLISISLAVAAIPEALPAMVTIALAFGAKKLVKSNALIRKLPAVETLGSITYICSDKTGTFTKNKMSVQEVYETPFANSCTIFNGKNSLLSAMALNNDLTIDAEGKLHGDSTELALVQFAENKNFKKHLQESLFPRVAELPFDTTRKCMTTLHHTKDGFIAITKGAAEMLFEKLHDNQKNFLPELKSKVEEMAEKGYRVLAYAVRHFPVLPDKSNAGEIESSLMLLGIAGLMDPPREEVNRAIQQCKEAGIIPVMITGDHQLTARAIAKQLGIISSENDIVLNGSELTKISPSDFENIVEKVRVYARVTPEQKLKIISALQNRNHYVAMTGDGVNDAPALKNADIGIAMGINGTEVSKEAAHMILLDDNFATIVIAIKRGRRIYDNILKFIKYIMTGNSGEIWAIFLAPFFGLPIPLLAIHILWINLVTDGLPGLALASEPADTNIMKRPAKVPGKNIFSDGMGVHILWVGFLMGISTIGIQAWAINDENAHWQTMAFTVLCLSQMGHVMAIRSDKESVFKTGVFSNKPLLGALVLTIVLQLMIIYLPFLNQIFHTQALSLKELIITILVSAVVFWAVEIEKLIKRTRKNIALKGS